MYEYGINLLLWTDKIIEEHLPLLRKVRKLGCDVVEIPIFFPEEFPADLVRKELDKTGLDVVVCCGCTPSADIASLNPNIRSAGIKHLKKVIDHANVLGAKLIGGVTYKAGGIFTGQAPTDEEWSYSVNSMKNLAQYAQQYEISIGVEQINRYETYFINTAIQAVEYCKAVDESNMFVLLDAHHLILEENDLYRAIVKSKDYLRHFHTAENNRGIPGTGLVDWKTVFQALKAINYEGYLVIESFFKGFGNIWRDLAPSKEKLIKQGIRNLKKIEKSVR
ncbi:MAG: sugar phosphate isomerase/epimerase family protein [Promethearchaeia archaeon]